MNNDHRQNIFDTMAEDTMCLVPARGGSKGIPQKNLYNCLGKPLISFTIETAKSLFNCTSIFVSSDDPQILTVASEQSVKTILRPSIIAQDDTPMISVIKHSLSLVSSNYKYLVLLQPTSPCRSATEILKAISMIKEEQVDVIASVSPTPEEYSPYLMIKIQNGEMAPLLPGKIPTRRQDTPRTFMRNGQFYVFNNDYIMKATSLYQGTPMPFITSSRGINIDTPADMQEFIAYLLNK